MQAWLKPYTALLWGVCLCGLESLPASAQLGYAQEGSASFYADRFEGRRTASGTRFSQRGLTCAHRELPFGTRLRITNLDNDKETTVEVTDRGPFRSSRILDLSLAAAEASIWCATALRTSGWK
jgi:rare lipoprotein A